MPLIRRNSATPAPPVDAGSSAEQTLRAGTNEERWAAARALSGQPQAVEALGAALATEQDPKVREAILTGLARIGTPRSVEAIAPLIRSDEASLRTSALDALRAMPQALEAHLAALLSDPDADVRLLACDLARHLPAGSANRLLADLLDHERQVNVCAAAVEVLAECGGPEALPALTACAVRFADEPFLSFSLKIAIDRIGGHAPDHDG